MGLKFKVNVDGMQKKFDLLTSAMKDLKPSLKEFDQHLKQRIQQRFDQNGPDWPALSDESKERHISKAFRTLERKLGREVWRAAESAEAKSAKLLEREYKKVERKLGGELWRSTNKLENKKTTKSKARQKKRITEKQAALEAFWQYKALQGGVLPEKVASKVASAEKEAHKRTYRALIKRMGTLQELRTYMSGRATSSLSEKLQPRVGRALKKSEKMLGQLHRTFQSTITNKGLVRKSTVPWAYVHNEGNIRVGRGSLIPPRPFIFLDKYDVDILVDILKDRMLLAME
jgi:phage gpG-like protein